MEREWGDVTYREQGGKAGAASMEYKHLNPKMTATGVQLTSEFKPIVIL